MSDVTRESLNTMLHNENPRYVQTVIGRALWALFLRQTEDEQNSNDTHQNNSIGFSGADGKSGSLTAKYWMKHKRLEDWMVAKWMKPARNGYPRLCKYVKQLNEIAEAK